MKSTRSILKWGGAVLLALLAASQASAAGTPANTLISNTANADYSINGNPAATVSDTVDFNVDELIDVTVDKVGGAVSVSTPENKALIAFDVTNTGNGEEIFDLGLNGNVSGDDFDVTFDGNFAYLDANDNGSFDAGTDTAFNPVTGTSDLTLQPDEIRRVFILSDIPAGLADGNVGDVVLSASTTTGALAGATPGTTEAGAGTGGVDAVVGSTQGTDSDQQRYIVSAVNVTIDKTVFSIDDGFGGSELIPGAVVTYRIAVDVSGSGIAEGLLISDTIAEAGTSDLAYLKGSVSVNGVSQTDADDPVTGSEFTTVNFNAPADASLASGAPATGGVDIAVNLGDVSPGGGTVSYTIDLQVEIQ